MPEARPDPDFTESDSWADICAAQDRKEEDLDSWGDGALAGKESWQSVQQRHRFAHYEPPPDGLGENEARWAAHNLPHPWWWHGASGQEVQLMGLSPLFPGDGAAIPLGSDAFLEDLAREWIRLHRAYPTPWLRRFGEQLADELTRRKEQAS